MSKTKIEWATHTVNWLAGCTKVSPACTNCYAEGMSARLATMPRAPDRYKGGTVRCSLDGSGPFRSAIVDEDTRRWTGNLVYDPAAMQSAFGGMHAAKKPRRVFVNSMSDTFHESAPPESLVHLANEIKFADLPDTASTPSSWMHTIMLLTKRPARLLAWQREHFPDGLPSWVWVGTTVEDQKRANERLPVLAQVRANVTFASVEPMVGAVDLDSWLYEPFTCGDCGNWHSYYMPVGEPGCGDVRCANCESTNDFAWTSLGWVIVGGESGSNARPMHPRWARSLRDQCVAASVPFHFKQWGEWADSEAIESCGLSPHGWHEQDPRDGGHPVHSWPDAHVRDTLRKLGKEQPSHAIALDTHVYRVGKKHAGRVLDGRTWDEVPR